MLNVDFCGSVIRCRKVHAQSFWASSSSVDRTRRTGRRSLRLLVAAKTVSRTVSVRSSRLRRRWVTRAKNCY